jgi:hypothetical protein
MDSNGGQDEARFEEKLGKIVKAKPKSAIGGKA